MCSKPKSPSALKIQNLPDERANAKEMSGQIAGLRILGNDADADFSHREGDAVARLGL